MAKKKRKRDNESAGIAFVAFLFIGFAISILMGRWDAMPFVGLGLGFLAMLVVMLKYRK
jgi:hypothetical protein